MIFHVLILLTLKKRNAWLSSTKSKPNEASNCRETLDESKSEEEMMSRKASSVRVNDYYRLSYHIVNIREQLRI